MINFYEVAETNQMIEQENLDEAAKTVGVNFIGGYSAITLH